MRDFGKSITFSEFRNIVKGNNPSLTFFYNDNTGKHGCGIFKHDEFIMGVPLGTLPEYTVLAEDGRILKRGWRTTFGILLKKRLLRPDKHIARLMGWADIESWQTKGRSSKKEQIAIQL